jgi:hypothetical protein
MAELGGCTVDMYVVCNMADAVRIGGGGGVGRGKVLK